MSLDPRSGQFKDYKIGICCFSAKHAALKNKNKQHIHLKKRLVIAMKLLKNCLLREALNNNHSLALLVVSKN
jgi:hypothetical protein